MKKITELKKKDSVYCSGTDTLRDGTTITVDFKTKEDYTRSVEIGERLLELARKQFPDQFK